MNTLIFQNSAFPFGGAATNRVIHIAKILQESNIATKIVCMRPTEHKDEVVNTKLSGVYDSIEYFYTCDSIIWPESKMKKLVIYIVSFFKLLIISNSIDKKNKIDVIILNAYYNYFNTSLIFLFCKLKKIKFVYAVDEYPLVRIAPKSFTFLYKRFYLNTYYRMFDGFIVISKTLIKYYKQKASKNTPFVHLPMTIETERFDCEKLKKKEKDVNVAYCGSDTNIDMDKDGVELLIRAFHKVNIKHKNTTLTLIGKMHQSRRKLVKELGVEKKVIFKGLINREQMPEELCNSSVLVLARPSSLRAAGGFPTKLGEYLATGKPVVVTNVGEITNYLKDNISAYIVEPDNIDLLADKIDYVINNYDEAYKVGLKGKKIAETVFDYKNHTYLIEGFLNSLCKKKSNIQIPLF